MSATPEAEIFTALIDALGSEFTVSAPLAGTAVVSGTNTVEIAEFAGQGFETPSSKLWIEARLFPREPRNMGHGGEIADRGGYLQATCCIKRQKWALFYVSNLASQLAAAFPLNRRLNTTTQGRVKIDRDPGVAFAFEDDGVLKMPVHIYYRHPAG